MQRTPAWAAVALTIAVSARPAAAGRCTTPAKANATIAKTSRANDKRLATALAKEHVTRLQLEERPLDSDEEKPTARDPRLVVTGRGAPNCRRDPVEFVADGAKVYRLVRSPQLRRKVVVDLCACPPVRCGGAKMQPVEFVVELPQGSSYAGERTIEYEADDVQINYAPKGKCPRPP